MSLPRPARSFVIVAALLFWGSAQAQYAPGGCREPSSGGIRLAIEPRSSNALIADATVELASPAAVYLEYGNPAVGWLRTSTVEASATHRIGIIRLRADSIYQVRAFALDAASCPVAAASGEFKTGQLPEWLRSHSVESTGQPSFPLLMMDWPSLAPFLPPNAPGDRNRYLVATDQDGQVVWYYVVPREYPIPPREVSAYAIVRRANGNLLYLAAYNSVEEITPDGAIVRRFRSENPPASRPHHDLVELPDGRVLFLGHVDRAVDDTPNGGPPDLLLRGDTLQVADLSTGAGEEVWNAFDSLDPTARFPEWEAWKTEGVQSWTHSNAVALGQGGNVLISIRNLDQIVSLSPDFKAVEWKLGGPGSDFAFADPADRFRGQHAVHVLPNGHILMFDNGPFKPEGEYSRALELELDFATMTARKVWEFRPQPDIFAAQLSNVVRLPNGDSLVNFGWRTSPDEPAVAMEVAPDGERVWEQTVRWKGIRAVRYRVYPLTSLAGETSVP